MQVRREIIGSFTLPFFILPKKNTLHAKLNLHCMQQIR